MKLSFGMIFSIILIIVFLTFAFYVIKLLLQSQSQSKVLIFKEDLENDIDKIWRGSGSLRDPDGYKLPRKVELACFIDFSAPSRGDNQDLFIKLRQVYYEFENLIFYPIGSAQGLNAVEIKHINIENITRKENPYCIENIDGKVILTIKRDYGEEGVIIER